MAKYSRHKKLALLLVFPQLLITLLFFIWPALNALMQSFLFSDAFGIHSHFAGLINFIDLISDPAFLKSLLLFFLLSLLPFLR